MSRPIVGWISCVVLAAALLVPTAALADLPGHTPPTVGPQRGDKLATIRNLFGRARQRVARGVDSLRRLVIKSHIALTTPPVRQVRSPAHGGSKGKALVWAGGVLAAWGWSQLMHGQAVGDAKVMGGILLAMYGFVTDK